MNTFQLYRDVDVSGVSGTGVVADGVVFPDGVVVIRWRGERASTVVWPGIADVEAIHGHGGATRIVYGHEAEPPPDRSWVTTEQVRTKDVPWWLRFGLVAALAAAIVTNVLWIGWLR